MKKRNLFFNLCQERTLLAAWKLVKQKGSSGGIDGMSIDSFEEKLGVHIAQLKQSLLDKSWQPEPYLRISIPKKENERRILGLLSIKDKIVQQAIKLLVEPRFEKMFVSNSYGYRPGKGHNKAIGFARACVQNKLFRFASNLKKQVYGVIFWAVTVIECAEDIENVRMAVGSNSASMWWLNGEETVILSGDRRMVKDDCLSRRVTLKKGKNIVRGAVINGPGMSDFCLRFVYENGEPVKDITISYK